MALYRGLGLTGLVCACVGLCTTPRQSTPTGVDRPLLERWGLRTPLGFVLAGYSVLGCVLAAPFDEWWHQRFGLDVTVWSPPHLFAVGAAAAIRLGGHVALAREMPPATAKSPWPQGRRWWPRVPCAEVVFSVLFSLFLGDLTFVLGGYDYGASWHDGVAYAAMASMVVPLVLVAGVHRLKRRGAATGIVLLLMLWQELLRAALLISDYMLPAFLPSRPVQPDDPIVLTCWV